VSNGSFIYILELNEFVKKHKNTNRMPILIKANGVYHLNGIEITNINIYLIRLNSNKYKATKGHISIH